jgi:hypothetical protein
LKRLNNITRAWLAGFMDGEGSIQIRQAKSSLSKCISFYPQVEVGNTYKPVMKYIASLFDKPLQIRRNKEIRKRKVFYRITFKKYDSIIILKLIKPYLKIKKEQAKLCLELYKTYRTKIKRYTSGRIKKLSMKTYKNRIRLFNLNRKLNKRGKKAIEGMVVKRW